MKMGVTYWDTADGYGWGKNEKAIGKYFAKFPNDRKKVFLVTKAGTSDPKKLTEKLNTSLQRMNTSSVDLYFIHYVNDVKDELTPDVKGWAGRRKTWLDRRHHDELQLQTHGKRRDEKSRRCLCQRWNRLDGHENSGGILGKLLCINWI